MPVKKNAFKTFFGNFSELVIKSKNYANVSNQSQWDY